MLTIVIEYEYIEKKVTYFYVIKWNLKHINYLLILSNTSKLKCRLQKCLHHEMLNEILNVTNLSKYKSSCCNSSNDFRLPIENLFYCFQPLQSQHGVV